MGALKAEEHQNCAEPSYVSEDSINEGSMYLTKPPIQLK